MAFIFETSRKLELVKNPDIVGPGFYPNSHIDVNKLFKV